MGNAIEWLAQPLCSCYHLVVVQTCSVPISGFTTDPNASLRWAVGFLSSGERELLGLWKASTWADTLSDLEARGVTEIRFIVTPERLGLAPSSESCIGAPGQISSAVEGASRVPGLHRAKRLRRALDVANADVAHLRTSVDGAIARHGRFASEGDAMSVVLAALVRAESELDARALRHLAGRSRAVRQATSIAEAAPA